MTNFISSVANNSGFILRVLIIFLMTNVSLSHAQQTESSDSFTGVASVSSASQVSANSNSFFYDFCPTEFTVSSNTRTWRANRRNLQVIPINVRFSETTASCVTHILFYTDNNTSLILQSGSDTVETNLVDRNRSDFAQYSIGGRIAWVVPVYFVRNLRVWAQLNTTDALIAGNYSGVISVVATYFGFHISPEVLGTVNLEVPSVLEVGVSAQGSSAIYGGSGYYFVELGNLYEGLNTGWDIDIYSNVHYQVAVHSENKGLKHETSDTTIPYTVSMDGNRFEATTGYSKGYTNYNPLTTSSIPFQISVGNVDFKPAGRYTDNLIVTVSAR